MLLSSPGLSKQKKYPDSLTLHQALLFLLLLAHWSFFHGCFVTVMWKRSQSLSPCRPFWRNGHLPRPGTDLTAKKVPTSPTYPGIIGQECMKEGLGGNSFGNVCRELPPAWDNLGGKKQKDENFNEWTIEPSIIISQSDIGVNSYRVGRYYESEALSSCHLMEQGWGSH